MRESCGAMVREIVRRCGAIARVMARFVSVVATSAELIEVPRSCGEMGREMAPVLVRLARFSAMWREFQRDGTGANALREDVARWRDFWRGPRNS